MTASSGNTVTSTVGDKPPVNRIKNVVMAPVLASSAAESTLFRRPSEFVCKFVIILSRVMRNVLFYVLT